MTRTISTIPSVTSLEDPDSKLEIRGPFRFTEEGVNDETLDNNWPVVYILTGDEEAYIGETYGICGRLKQHLANEERRTLNEVRVISSLDFNKSATLDIEQSLIRLFSADGQYRLQNTSPGLSPLHEYYQRSRYQDKVPRIWERLYSIGMASQPYPMLVNSQIYKFSPYTALTEEQKSVLCDVLEWFQNVMYGQYDAPSTFVIEGGAGTGKTLLAVSTLNELVEIQRFRPSDNGGTGFNIGFLDMEGVVSDLHRIICDNGGVRMGFVVPMTSLRTTLQGVFREIESLKGVRVMGPSDVVNEYLKNGQFDILFVDESHRLTSRRGITNYSEFDSKCQCLGMDPQTANQLEWIVRSSKCRVLFYDPRQTVKTADITQEEFEKTLSGSFDHRKLSTQIRCDAGNGYPDYLETIFACTRQDSETFEKYDLRIYDDVGAMVDQIRKLDKTNGLSRTVAGYAWKWVTKGMSKEEIKNKGLYDIEIGSHRYVWNMSNKEWIRRPDATDEIGCIHTSQGYDLNYVGVIFGPEIDYDEASNCITVDPKRLFDMKVKERAGAEEVRRFVINSYQVMMTRGIKGCYVYACNESMAKYLRRFIPRAE